MYINIKSAYHLLSQTFQQMQAQASQMANQVANQIALSAQVAKAAQAAANPTNKTLPTIPAISNIGTQPVFPHPIAIAPIMTSQSSGGIQGTAPVVSAAIGGGTGIPGKSD